jgi:LPS-assembly protein
VLDNARFNLLIFTAATALVHWGVGSALPELSSLEPLEFDEASQRLIARGDARLDYGETRLRADRITYYQEFSLADAEGNIAVTQEGRRLIADRMSFDATENAFTVDILRTGQWPFHVSGVTAGGSESDIAIQGATLYYGEPGRFTPSISADEVRYVEGDVDYVRMDGATLRIGRIPFLYLPGYTHYFNNAPYMLDFGGGQDDKLGAYFQSTTLFPITSFLRMGANADYYTERGALAGPTAQYVYNSETQEIIGAVSTAYIDDQGSLSDRDVDQLGQQIDAERGFAEWRHKHHIGERFTATAIASYWTDSEVTRDFRDELYEENQSPDNFAEAAYTGDNFIVSAFGRFRPNDFELVQERLPEVRLDLLPTQILKTGAYHRAGVSYAQLREDFDLIAPAVTVESQSDRFDFAYRIERPIHLRPWLTFTPLAGARITDYSNQQIDNARLGGTPLLSESFTREIFEAGFDLEMRAYRNYSTINRTWDVNGLRHIIRPVIRYRYFSDPEDLNEIAAIDRSVLNLERPILDLSDLRNVDQIPETHLTRIGLENLFQTRAEGYGSRTLAALNFYQDVLFEKDTRFDGSEQETFNATWVELILEPAPWLKFEFASRFQTESLTLDELRTRTRLISGEIWELGLSTDLLNKQIDQYRLDFIYRVNERYALLSDLRVDADRGELTHLSLGVRSRIGSTWEVLYALTFREDARRESDVEFGIKLRLVDPEF